LCNDLIMGVDVGTTETKAILMDEDGNLISESSRELQLIHVKEGRIEQDLEGIWVETARAIKDCTISADRMPSGLSITGQRETICPIDKGFGPIGNAISWQDTRGWEICRRMKEEFGNEGVYRITGLPVNTMPSASKMAWIRENEPSIYDKVWKFVGVVDYIVWKLSGTLMIDHSNACRTMLFDLSRLRWASKIFEYLKLDVDKMPEVTPPGQIVGSVTRKASEETNLKDGMPVIYGGGDQQCSALGAGITDSKRISCVLGTCTNIEAYSESLPLDPKMRLQAQLHVIPNCYLSEGGIGSSGSIYRWFRDNFGDKEVLMAKRAGSSAYALLDDEAEKAPPGSEGLMMIPYFVGSLYPYWNADDRGLFVGLRLNQSKEHFARAILEGIAYEYMGMVEDVERVHGTKAGQVRFIGGGANSRIWPQIIVDVLGMEGLVLKNVQAGALGAAILGSSALGWFKDARRAAESLIKVDRRIEANSNSHSTYMRYYNVYGGIYGRVQDLVNEISKIERDVEEF